MKRSAFLFCPFLFLASGCAVLHHVQIGQIDNRSNEVLIPFDIKVSETGVSTEEIGRIGRAANTQGGDAVQGVAAIVSLFQTGPRTGNIVYDERYAERVVYQIYEKCPSGRVTGLASIRESRQYPVISGEIVKITGFCRKSKKSAPKEQHEPGGDSDEESAGGETT